MTISASGFHDHAYGSTGLSYVRSCGRSSVVEHEVSNLGAAGSIPAARFRPRAYVRLFG